MPYPASYFRLNMFRQCRQRYKLHYVDGLAEEYSKARPYLTMGEHVHGALRDLFSLPVDESSEDRPEKGNWIHDDCREPARGAGDLLVKQALQDGRGGWSRLNGG